MVAGVAAAAVYLGTGLASDVIGGLFLGVAAGAVVHIAFGAPGGRPTMAELRDAARAVGLRAPKRPPRSGGGTARTTVEATTEDGTLLRVVAFGRDQRDGQYFAKLWRSLAFREPGVAVFGSRLQQVEHLALGLLLAGEAGVRAAGIREDRCRRPGRRPPRDPTHVGCPVGGSRRRRIGRPAPVRVGAARRAPRRRSGPW